MLRTSDAFPVLTAAAAADYGWLGNAVVAIMEAVGPIGVALAVFAENLFPPIPSELILPLAGFTAAGGAFTPLSATVWATVGSVVGALALYGVGAALGRRRMYRIADRLPLVDIDDVEATERWFARYGTWSVLLGRLIPVFRSLISIPAGIEGMHLGLFLLHTTLGSAVWNAVLVYGGYLLGANFHLVSDYADLFSNVVVALVAVAVVAWVVLRLRRNHRRAKDPDFRPRTADEAAAHIDSLLSSHDPRK